MTNLIIYNNDECIMIEYLTGLVLSKLKQFVIIRFIFFDDATKPQ